MPGLKSYSQGSNGKGEGRARETDLPSTADRKGAGPGLEEARGSSWRKPEAAPVHSEVACVCDIKALHLVNDSINHSDTSFLVSSPFTPELMMPLLCDI